MKRENKKRLSAKDDPKGTGMTSNAQVSAWRKYSRRTQAVAERERERGSDRAMS